MPARPRTLLALAVVALALLAWVAPRLWKSGAADAPAPEAARAGGDGVPAASEPAIDPRVRELQPDVSCVPPARGATEGRAPRCVLSFGRALTLGAEPGGKLAVVSLRHAALGAWALPALTFARPFQGLDVDADAQVILVSDGRGEALLAAGGELLRYATASGRVVERRAGPGGMIEDAAWSGDGERVVVAAAGDGTAYLLDDAAAPRALRTDGRAVRVAIDAAGERGAVATEIGGVTLFALADAAMPPRQTTPSLQPAAALGFAGELLWVAGSDGTLRALDRDGAAVARVDVGVPLLALAINADGRRAATAGRDHVVRVHALPSGEVLERLAWHQGRVTGLAWGTDATLLSADVDGELAAWDAPAAAR